MFRRISHGKSVENCHCACLCLGLFFLPCISLSLLTLSVFLLCSVLSFTVLNFRNCCFCCHIGRQMTRGLAIPLKAFFNEFPFISLPNFFYINGPLYDMSPFYEHLLLCIAKHILYNMLCKQRLYEGAFFASFSIASLFSLFFFFFLFLVSHHYFDQNVYFVCVNGSAFHIWRFILLPFFLLSFFLYSSNHRIVYGTRRASYNNNEHV